LESRHPARPAKLNNSGENVGAANLDFLCEENHGSKRGIRVNAVALGVIKTPMHPVETHAQLGAQSS
jgi:hypothetical protein